MLFIDVLTAYLICGVSGLVGAAMLRIAETDDARLRTAVRVCGWGLVTLGVGLLPAGLGERAGHPLAQLSLSISSLVGVALVARGVGQLQGRSIPLVGFVALAGTLAALCVLAQLAEPLLFGLVYALLLASVGTLLSWLGRGFLLSPRDLVERGLGLCLLLIAGSSWIRVGFTLGYEGPAKVSLLYVPRSLEPVFAALYAVMPMVIATLLLSLLNARLRQQLRSRALTDELTSTMTRRAFGEQAPATIEVAQRRHHAVAVLMLDLDHFKIVNDTYGHAIGDQVLKGAAATLQANLRHDALLARYGGEEFVVLLPVDDLVAARQVAERLRVAIESATWSTSVKMVHGVTVSVGVALLDADGSLETALQRADKALYDAKREGRNRVQVSLRAA
jgi:diguanylate cyclase (GGDEF)-like protein